MKLKKELILEIYSFMEQKEILRNNLNINKRLNKIILEFPFELKLKLDKIQKFYEKFKNIKALNFNYYSNKIQLDGIKFLGDLNINSLKILDLSYNELGPDLIKYLSKINSVKLQELILVKNNLGIDGIKNLMASEFPKLKKLDISNNQLNSNSIEFLAQLNFSNLKILDISDNKFEGKLAKNFQDFKFLNLEELYINSSHIQPKGFKYLLKAYLPNLNYLDLKENSLGNDPEKKEIKKNKIKYLADLKFSNLKELDISINNIGTKGIVFLSKANIPNLKYLTIGCYEIGYPAIRCVSSSKKFNELLRYSDDDFTKEERKIIFRKFKNVNVHIADFHEKFYDYQWMKNCLNIKK